MAKHAALGASSMKRWQACPGSPRLIAEAGIYEPPSIHARKGTTVHAVLESVLRGEMAEPEDAIGRVFEGLEVDANMAASARTTVDYVRDRLAAAPHIILLIEQKVDLSEYAPPGEPMFGRTDVALVDLQAGELEIVDHKDGAGVVVEVISNPQLRYYGLGTYLSLTQEQRNAIHTVRSTVSQPNAHHDSGPIRSEELSIFDLLAWGEELREAALATTKPDAPLKAGDHCRWCGARSVCGTRNSNKVLAVEEEFGIDLEPEPTMPTVLEQARILSPDQVGKFLVRAKELSRLIKDAEEYLTREALKGRAIAGFKLVEGRGSRVFLPRVSDAMLAIVLGVAEEEVDDVVDIMGLDRESITIPDVLRMLDVDEGLYWEPRKTVTPAGLEKKVGKKHPSYKKLELLSERRAGRPLLVPETDNRPAIENIEDWDVDTLEGEFEIVAE